MKNPREDRRAARAGLGRVQAVAAGMAAVALLVLAGASCTTTSKRNPTPTFTPWPSWTPTITRTSTATSIFTLTHTATDSGTRTGTPSATRTATVTATRTATSTPTLGQPTVVVIASPTANIRIWDPVHFDARQTTGANPMTFTWNFGDGSALAYGKVIAHHYVQPGSYTAVLSVSNSFGTSTANTSVTVIAEPAPNMSYLSQYALSNIAGLWAKPPLAYLPEMSNPGKFHLIDVSTPTSPQIRATMTNVLRPREARAFGHYLIGASEPQYNGFSWSIVNAETPTAPTVVGTFGAGLSASHTIGYWDNMVIVNTARSWTPQIVFYDVRDPAAPTQIGTWSGSPSGVHDSQRVGNLLYVAAPYHGFYILDITNPSAPTTVVDHTYAGGYTHNVWPSKTGQYVLTTEEDPGQPLRIWDVSNPSSVTLVATWLPPTGSAIIHNVVVVGDYAHVACYTYGYVVLDISNPASPQMIYHYDTYPANDNAIYDGCWFMVPFGDRVYVSDISGGLFTFGK